MHILDLALNIYGDIVNVFAHFNYISSNSGTQQLGDAVEKPINLRKIRWNPGATSICIAGNMNGALSAASRDHKWSWRGGWFELRTLVWTTLPTLLASYMMN